MAKRFMLTEPGFFGSLLAPGSIITTDDLGETTVTEGRDKGKTVQIRPPASAIEVDKAGNPVDDAKAEELQAIIAQSGPIPIAPVQPFSPNPTQAQGAPAQAPGSVQVAEQALPTEPAPVLGSEPVTAAKAEEPKRRSGGKSSK